VVAGDACEPSVLDRLGLDTVETVVAAPATTRTTWS
jgi:Trk K+ transport system NAD-binding subunit